LKEREREREDEKQGSRVNQEMKARRRDNDREDQPKNGTDEQHPSFVRVRAKVNEKFDEEIESLVLTKRVDAVLKGFDGRMKTISIV
jgi:hypothetical protein